MASQIETGYYWVKFYNHSRKMILYWNGKGWERFPSDRPIHDEIESYELIEARK